MFQVSVNACNWFAITKNVLTLAVSNAKMLTTTNSECAPDEKLIKTTGENVETAKQLVDSMCSQMGTEHQNQASAVHNASKILANIKSALECNDTEEAAKLFDEIEQYSAEYEKYVPYETNIQVTAEAAAGGEFKSLAERLKSIETFQREQLDTMKSQLSTLKQLLQLNHIEWFDNSRSDYGHPYNLIDQSEGVYPYDYKCPFMFDVMAHRLNADGSTTYKMTRAIYIPNVLESCAPASYDGQVFGLKKGSAPYKFTMPWWRSNSTKMATSRGKIRFHLVAPSTKADDVHGKDKTRAAKSVLLPSTTSSAHETTVWICDSSIYNNSFMFGQDFAPFILYVDHRKKLVKLRNPDGAEPVELPFNYLIVARKMLYELSTDATKPKTMSDDEWIRIFDEESAEHQKRKKTSSNNHNRQPWKRQKQ